MHLVSRSFLFVCPFVSHLIWLTDISFILKCKQKSFTMWTVRENQMEMGCSSLSKVCSVLWTRAELITTKPMQCISECVNHYFQNVQPCRWISIDTKRHGDGQENSVHVLRQTANLCHISYTFDVQRYTIYVGRFHRLGFIFKSTVKLNLHSYSVAAN